MKLRLPKIRSRRGEAADPTDPGTTPSVEPEGSPAIGSVLRGYGPLVAFAALFVLMAGFVPTVKISANGGAAAPGGSNTPYVNPAQQNPSSGGPASPKTPGTKSGNTQVAGATQTGGGGSSTGGGSTSGGGTTAAAQTGGSQGSCAGKDRQMPGDPYSPPCIEWNGGDNGGSTSRGVSKDTITISFRQTNEKGFNQTLATLAGADIVDTPADIKRTVEAFQKFFNDHYQFYGRKLNIEFFNGKGSVTTELLGGGQAEAKADADHVAQEMQAFIEMNGASEPYVDALSKDKVIGFGTPYLSRDWHVQHRPWAWSIATDCSIVAETAAELVVNTLAGKNAQWAQGNLKGKPRVFAGLSPENAWYQVCHDEAINVIKNAGYDPGLKVNYRLDINSMSNQAANVVAQLKSYNGGATTVLCGCDPIFPVFLTAKAKEQNYYPEWVVLGTALTDWDVAAQLYDQQEWADAFGVSSLGLPRPIRAGLGYSAYKTERSDEPAFSVELIYGTMLLISTGIEMAGPNLDPSTFEQGLRHWPGGTGPYGTWGFYGQNDFTPTRDYRVVFWDPNAVSIVNNQKGAYQTAYDNKRFTPGHLPTGDLHVFGQ